VSGTSSAIDTDQRVTRHFLQVMRFTNSTLLVRGLQRDVGRWLTNSALVYEPKLGRREGSRGVSTNEYPVQLYTEAQINFGDLTPDLTYRMLLVFNTNCSKGYEGPTHKTFVNP
jgi:hypothetical protein